jgi:hydroxyacylglutathione hydrolase
MIAFKRGSCLKIHQIFTANQLRNFNYLLETERGNIYCIDPWDAKFLSKEIESRNGKLVSIINTHEHFDHVKGNEALVERWGAGVWVHENAHDTIPGATRSLKAGEEIQLEDDCFIKVLDTPGHTMAQLCLLYLEKGKPKAIFCGDTLFNAGVGNCHNGGDPETLYETISEQIASLPDDVLVYPGHEYLVNNLRFTLDREPSNKQASALLEKQTNMSSDSNFLVSNIGQEKEINTFFRLGSLELRKNLGMDKSATDKDVFLSLRQKRNDW